MASSARVIDGRGAFVIPGPWDMHAHLFGRTAESGSVQAGRAADLVLLDANPLANTGFTPVHHAKAGRGTPSPAATPPACQGAASPIASGAIFASPASPALSIVAAV